MTPSPYPADTKAKGWRFELDIDQVMQSDTWALAPHDIRPWLLMIWSISWQQIPCGSLPADDAVIAARIGMKLAAFMKNKAILLRGWAESNDGRLYHPTITQRVLSMLETKQKEKDRKAAYRAKMSGNVPRDNQGTAGGQTGDSHGSDPGRDATGTGTGTGTSLKPYTNQPANAGVREPEKFAMRIGWQPSAHVADLAKQSGVDVTPAAQAEFLAHWLTEPATLRTQAEWDKALLQSAKHSKLREASPLPRKTKLPAPENFAEKDYGTGVNLL